MKETCSVVVHDPNDVHPEGEPITGDGRRNLALQHGVVLVNADLDLVVGGEAGQGYVRRSWGKTGVPIDSVAAVPKRVCPVLVHALPGKNVFEWVARLGVSTRDFHPTGTLRLATNPGSMGSASALVTVKHVDLNSHDEQWSVVHDELLNHGMVVRGEAYLRTIGAQLVQLCLWPGGGTRGIAVQWLAIGQRVEEGSSA